MAFDTTSLRTGQMVAGDSRETALAGFPLSPFQRRIWIADELTGGPVYNIAFGWRVTGPLHRPHLRSAVRSLGDRHEALRLRVFVRDGEVRQAVAPEAASLEEVELAPAQGPVPADTESALEALIDGQARRRFVLGEEPPVRWLLVRRSDLEHVLLVVLHHVAADGWSMGLLSRELGELYAANVAGRPADLPMSRPLRSLVALEQAASDAASGAAAAHWHALLDRTPPPLPLPYDRPARPAPACLGDSVPLRIPGATVRAMRALAASNGSSLFMVLAASVQVLLHRYTGESILRLSYPVARRKRVDVRHAIGCFINVAVMETQVDGAMDMVSVLGRIKASCEAAAPHHDAVLESVLPPPEGGAHADVLLNLSPFDQPELSLVGATCQPLPRRSRGAPSPLSWFLTEHPLEGLVGRLEFQTERFDAATAERLAGHWIRLVTALVSQPTARIGLLPMMSDEEVRQLIDKGRTPPRGGPADPPHLRVIRQAIARPDAPAIWCEGQSLSYGEVDAASRGLARHLRQTGVGPGIVVGVALPRGPLAAVALLAVLRAEGLYLPLDLAAPAARTRMLLADAHCGVLVTDRRHSGSLRELTEARMVLADGTDGGTPSNEPSVEPAAGASAAADARGAYCLYTSGSTGLPKGVVVSVAAISEHIDVCIDAYELGPADRVLQFAATTFDTSIEQMLATWCAGGTLVMRGDSPWSVEELVAVLRQRQVTVADLPVSYWHLLCAIDDPALPDLRLLIVGGEPVVARDAPRRRLAPRGLIAYGPTEATITCTLGPLDDVGGANGPFVPIGRPLPGTGIHVLDAALQLQPLGAPGELCVAGRRIADGYLGRAALTEAAFVQDPFGSPGSRLYRTGDMGRMMPDGRIEFLGRRDLQVKVRGVRIELGEIESALLSHPSVRDAAVLVAGEPGLEVIAACVVPAQPPLSLDALRTAIGMVLPTAYQPARWQTMEALPLTSNGKVDRRAMRALFRDDSPPVVEIGSSPQSTGEATDTLRILSTLLRELSPAQQAVAPDLPLVSSGFHSWQLIRLVGLCRSRFNVELKVRDLMRARTARGIAHLIDGCPPATPTPIAP